MPNMDVFAHVMKSSLTKLKKWDAMSRCEPGGGRSSKTGSPNKAPLVIIRVYSQTNKQQVFLSLNSANMYSQGSVQFLHLVSFQNKLPSFFWFNYSKVSPHWLDFTQDKDSGLLGESPIKTPLPHALHRLSHSFYSVSGSEYLLMKCVYIWWV